MRNARLDEAQAGIKIARRNINNLRYADDTFLRAKRRTIESLDESVKEEGEKVGLKLHIQKMKILVPGPITSWKIDGETMETVRKFILGAPNSLQMVIAAMKLKDACSLEEVMTYLDSLLKIRDIANKDPSSQSYGFSSSHIWM